MGPSPPTETDESDPDGEDLNRSHPATRQKIDYSLGLVFSLGSSSSSNHTFSGASGFDIGHLNSFQSGGDINSSTSNNYITYNNCTYHNHYYVSCGCYSGKSWSYCSIAGGSARSVVNVCGSANNGSDKMFYNVLCFRCRAKGSTSNR